MWTLFWDMHSGGGKKEPPYDMIYIEAPESEARIIFYNRFGHNPERVTCTCCGEDYSISEAKTFEQVAGYHLGWEYDNKKKKYIDKPSGNSLSFNPYCSVKEYVERDDILVIYEKDIKDNERVGDVPEQGYVWV